MNIRATCSATSTAAVARSLANFDAPVAEYWLANLTTDTPDSRMGFTFLHPGRKDRILAGQNHESADRFGWDRFGSEPISGSVNWELKVSKTRIVTNFH